MRPVSSFCLLFLLLALLLSLLLSLPLAAQQPDVRLWSPYVRGSLAHTCLSDDLDHWMNQAADRQEQAPVPHRFINLPDGR